VVAFAFPVVTGAAMLVIWATANPGVDPAELERALWGEIEEVGREVPDEELARALTSIEARQIIGLQQVGERADHLSMYTTLFDDPGRINTELDLYRAVTAKQVRAVALEYLGSDAAVTLTYLPRATGRAD
jgi:zinc protease